MNRLLRYDPLAKARQGWGEETPREIVALAEACAAQTANVVARRLGYSDAVISAVLSAKYRGDLDKVFAVIRGAYLGETVMCPVLDLIGKDRCLSEQAKPFSATSSTRARLFRECPRCPHRQQKDVA